MSIFPVMFVSIQNKPFGGTPHMIYDLIKYDNTKLSTWRTCPLKGYYRHHLNLVPDAANHSAALDYGFAIHNALDVLYTTHDLEAAQKNFISTYVPLLEMLEACDPLGAQRHQLDMGTLMLRDYWNYWETHITDMELIAYEQFFSFDLKLNKTQSSCPDCEGKGHVPSTDPNLPPENCRMCNGEGLIFGPMYCGKVDKIFRDKHSGLIVGMDHKTTSLLNSAIISAFKISQQFRGYVYWLKRHSQWQNDCGEYFYYDILLKKKSSKFNDDNLPFYRDTCLAQSSFLDEWIDDVRKQVTIIQRYIDASKSWAIQQPENAHTFLPPQNSNACADFNRICSYFDLCSSPREYRETQATQQYDVQEWNPLSIDE